MIFQFFHSNNLRINYYFLHFSDMSYEQQLDFTKLYCHTHPYQLITNYCNDQKCLQGLCATCICSHTDMHAQIGTVPHYQNIRDTFCYLHDQLRNQLTSLQDDKCKLGTVRQAIQVKKITIRKTIRQLKEESLNKIREEFDSLENKIIADITTEQKKQGYHSSIRFESLDKNLTRESENLFSFIQGLNSPSFLDWARKLKKESLMESNQNRLKIEKQLEDNETYTANLKWNQNFLLDIENIIRKVFTLEFVIPKQNGQMKTCVTPFRQSNLNISTISRSSSQPKLSQSLLKNTSLVGLGKFTETSYSTFFNEAQKSMNMPLQKQSLLKKSSFNISEVSEGDFVGSKQNSMTRSSYVADPLAYERKSTMNVSAFSRPSFQNEKLTYLIQAKKNAQFDNPAIPMMGKGETSFGDSRVRLC